MFKLTVLSALIFASSSVFGQNKILLPQCQCPLNYSPVCGSDAKTYPNECNFKCSAKADPSLKIASQGECQKEAVCVCPYNYKPVCGSNGKTYSNECELACAMKYDPDLKLDSQKPCAELATVKILPCTCTMEWKPVCGSDTNTYPNECTFKCAAKFNSSLKLASKGECKKREAPCRCSRNYKPVCGSNGKTYSNECELACAMKYDPALKMDSAAPCVILG